jgi:hypothetical protein
MESRRPIPSSLPVLRPKPRRERQPSAECRRASPEPHTALAKFHSHSPRPETETVPSRSTFPRLPASCRTAQAAAPPNKARDRTWERELPQAWSRELSQAWPRELPQAYSARRRQPPPTPPIHLQPLPSSSVSASRSPSPPV